MCNYRVNLIVDVVAKVFKRSFPLLTQVAAKQVADNAHKHYMKSRVAPSPDAIKRSRDFTAVLPPHPALSW